MNSQFLAPLSLGKERHPEQPEGNRIRSLQLELIKDQRNYYPKKKRETGEEGTNSGFSLRGKWGGSPSVEAEANAEVQKWRRVRFS